MGEGRAKQRKGGGVSRVGERRGRAAEREGEDGWRFADGRPGETGGEGKRGDGREGGTKWEGSAGAVARWRGLHGSGSLALVQRLTRVSGAN